MNYQNSDYFVNKQARTFHNSEQATHLIIKRARQLVDKLIEDRGNDRPPFKPVEYTRLQGIDKIVITDLGEVSGTLIRFHEKSIITVNKKHNLARQNFSIAHEVGHILFSELNLQNYVNTVEYRTYNPQAEIKVRSAARERLCDAAATELLMPESFFIKYLSSFGTSIHSIERIASIFHVSIRAAVQRIAEVSIEPCIAMVWQPLLSTRLLRLALCKGPGINLASKANYVPLHTKVKYPSILHKAFEQDSPVKCYKSFKFGKEVKRLPTESKGFGRGENRFVVSLAYPER